MTVYFNNTSLRMASGRSSFVWETASYVSQKKGWPKFGKHILAQFDDETIVVYQAYNPAIAAFAVENQKFGGELFSFSRMSWIKTNFLWMTYRCGWASKKNQERVLAVRITRDGFEQILADAFTAEFQKSQKVQTKNITVRLQWDPDHSPNYGKLERKAIQLGLKDETLRRYATEWIVEIKDVTDFVIDQKKILDAKGEEYIQIPKERVYTLTNTDLQSKINLDSYDINYSDICQEDSSKEENQFINLFGSSYLNLEDMPVRDQDQKNFLSESQTSEIPDISSHKSNSSGRRVKYYQLGKYGCDFGAFIV